MQVDDVQVYAEVMDSVQTLDAGRRSMYDPDELEEEQRERELRSKVCLAALRHAAVQQVPILTWLQTAQLQRPTLMGDPCMQVNKQFSSFTKRVIQEIWERDFGCALCCEPPCTMHSLAYSKHGLAAPADFTCHVLSHTPCTHPDTPGTAHAMEHMMTP